MLRPDIQHRAGSQEENGEFGAIPNFDPYRYTLQECSQLLSRGVNVPREVGHSI
jgi:hypothetical protein